MKFVKSYGKPLAEYLCYANDLSALLYFILQDLTKIGRRETMKEITECA